MHTHFVPAVSFVLYSCLCLMNVPFFHFTIKIVTQYTAQTFFATKFLSLIFALKPMLDFFGKKKLSCDTDSPHVQSPISFCELIF